MGTVLVYGCFDMLHLGHIEFLQAAAAHGDRLVVCVARDENIAHVKGEYPFRPLVERVSMLEALECVDAVVLDKGLGLYAMRHHLRHVDVFVVSHEAGDDKKMELARAAGCDYVSIPRQHASVIRSSSALKDEAYPHRLWLAGVAAGLAWTDVDRRHLEGALLEHFLQATLSP